MEIKDKELDHGVLKVTMTGSLDVAGSDVADAHFAAIDQSKTRIVADQTHVDFLASVGMRVLVKTAKALGARGGKLVLLNPNDAARRVMFTTGLDRIVPIADDEQSAVIAAS